jgi:hypothetical protein
VSSKNRPHHVVGAHGEAKMGGLSAGIMECSGDVGYYPIGMPKMAVAGKISSLMDPGRNLSNSSQVFRKGQASSRLVKLKRPTQPFKTGLGHKKGVMIRTP